MNIKDLLERAANGWRPPHCGWAEEIVEHWKNRFDTSGEIKNVEENATLFSGHS